LFLKELFTVDHILEDRVVVNTALAELFAYEVTSTEEVYRHIDPIRIKSLIQTGRTGTGRTLFLYVLIHRFPVEDERLGKVYRTRVFYLTYDSDRFSSFVEGVTGRWVDGLELANSLLFAHSVFPALSGIDGERYLPLKKFYLSAEEFYAPLPRDVYRRSFRTAVHHALKQEEYRVYCSNVYLGVRPEGMWDLFRPPAGSVLAKWEGAVWITMVFNDAEPILHQKAESQRAWNQRYAAWKEAAELYKKGKLDIAPVSVFFITHDPNADRYADVLFEKLGFQGIRRSFDDWNVVLATPLKTADLTSFYFLKAEDIAVLVPTSFAKTTVVPDRVKGTCDLVGSSVSGELVFYSFWGDNPAQYSLIVAPTGSGKTFFLLNLLSEVNRINVKALYEGTGKPGKLPFKVRFLDVGLSGEFFVRLLKERGYDVVVTRPELSAVCLNPFEVNDSDDVDFAVGLTRLILETGRVAEGESVLTVDEERFLREALTFFVENRETGVQFPKLSELKERDPVLYDRITAEHPELDEYDALRLEHVKGTPYEYPRVNDVIAYLQKKKNAPGVTQVDRTAYESLISKLKYVASVPNFASYTSFDFRSAEFIYMDLMLIKNSTIFVPFIMAVLKKLIRQDSAFTGELKFYVVEEAHNLFRYKAFEQLFDTLTREARKHRIYLCYVSQKISDLSEAVLNGIHTRFVLRAKKDPAFHAEVKEKLNLSPEEEKIFAALPWYTPMVHYSGGVFTVKLPVDDAKLIVFDSVRTELKTPDGVVLRRGGGGKEGGVE